MPNRINSPIGEIIKYIRQPNHPREVSRSPQINIKTISPQPQLVSPKLLPKNAHVLPSPRHNVEVPYHESRVVRKPQAHHNLRNTDQPSIVCPIVQEPPAIKSEKTISSKENPFRMSVTRKHQEIPPKVMLEE
jgi:hypothetical protein